MIIYCDVGSIKESGELRVRMVYTSNPSEVKADYPKLGLEV